MAETAFSENAKYYSAISADGRLRIWDTETNSLKQEFTPDVHLTSPASCLLWLKATETADSQQNRSSDNLQELECIALGTNNGKILIYSVALAKVSTVLIERRNNVPQYSKVTSIDWHREYGLYSCNKNNQVLEWDLKSASVRYRHQLHLPSNNKQVSVISAIKIVPHSQKSQVRFLVAASWQVHVWRLHAGSAVVIKTLGHISSPKALLSIACMNERSWLIQGSQNERLLSFWDVTITQDSLPQTNGEEITEAPVITPSKKKRKKSKSEVVPVSVVATPMYYFALEDAPEMVDVRMMDDNGVKLTLAAATNSGVIHYYDHQLNGSSSKPIKPTVTIEASSAAAVPVPLPLRCCRLGGGGALLVGCGGPAGAGMLFNNVTPDVKSKTKTQVIIYGENKSAGKSKGKISEAKKLLTGAGSGSVACAEPPAPAAGPGRKRPAPGETNEVPMEERLSNLALDMPVRGKFAVNQNLTKLLMQGLTSKDQVMIDTVLHQNDRAVAARTVAALPADYLPPLLEQLADMATKRSGVGAAAMTWTREVLAARASQLLASAGAPRHAHALRKVLAACAERTTSLHQLYNVKGRTALLMSMLRRDNDTLKDQEPILQYNDSTSEEEMEIDQPYQSDSDGLWGEDEDKDEEREEDEDKDEERGENEDKDEERAEEGKRSEDESMSQASEASDSAEEDGD